MINIVATSLLYFHNQYYVNESMSVDIVRKPSCQTVATGYSIKSLTKSVLILVIALRL